MAKGQEGMLDFPLFINTVITIYINTVIINNTVEAFVENNLLLHSKYLDNMTEVSRKISPQEQCSKFRGGDKRGGEGFLFLGRTLHPRRSIFVYRSCQQTKPYLRNRT